MKVVFFYADIRTREEKVRAYSQLGLKIAAVALLIALNPASTAAYKAGNLYHLINAIPSGI
jgi:hypothetical protein